MKLTASNVRWIALAILILAFDAAQAQQTERRYDLLIKNGHVIDSKNSINELEEVILKSTWNPAKEIRREQFGHLTVGAAADVAVLRLERGDFGFVDSDKLLMKGTQRLACEMTLMGGNVMWDLNGRASEPWDKAATQVKK